MRNHLESIAIFVKDSYQVVGIINEKFDIIELVLAVQLGEKPSRYPFRCRRKQPELQYFVCLRTDSTAQPVVVVIDADHFLVDRELIRVNGDDYWLYGAVDPETNEILHFRPFPATTKQTTRWFLTDLHRRYRLDDVEFLVDDADYLVNVLDEDGYRFQMISHGNRNAIERVFWEIERRTSSFATSFSDVDPQTAESWLQALAVRHNSRQR